MSDSQILADAYEELENLKKEGGINPEFAPSGTFSDDVLDYGPDVAFAANEIELSIDELVGNDDILERIILRAFEKVEDEHYEIFSRLYEMLPKEAQDKIATEGF